MTEWLPAKGCCLQFSMSLKKLKIHEVESKDRRAKMFMKTMSSQFIKAIGE